MIHFSQSLLADGLAPFFSATLLVVNGTNQMSSAWHGRGPLINANVCIFVRFVDCIGF